MLSNQIIFYGPPGTGKSKTIQEIIVNFLQAEEDKVFRTVFHPEYDYNDFIGTYRPVMEKSEKNIERLNYRFIPGVLLRAYLKACEQNEPVVLVIEEINRGNCSAIFGDFFQLLDRNPATGESTYSIDVPLEVSRFLMENIYSKKNDTFLKLSLPSNFYIMATMNTSDQSVFPLDSAFIRRWSWRYKGIDYKDADQFYIQIGNVYYSWGNFLQVLNEKIYLITESEDRQLGNRFIMPNGSSKIINTNDFVEKVLFYLWNEIYKHEDLSSEAHIFWYITYVNGEEEEHSFTFSQLFNNNRDEILNGFMKYNEIPIVDIDEDELEKVEEELAFESFIRYKNDYENEIPIDTALFFSYSGITGKGLYKGKNEEKRKKDTILVQKGSQMTLDTKRGMPYGLDEIRMTLIKNEIVEKKEGYYEFVQEWLFDTPSEAAGVLGGQRLTGTSAWKTADGRNINHLKGKK